MGRRESWQRLLRSFARFYNPVYAQKGNAKAVAQQLRKWYGMRVTRKDVQAAIDANRAAEGNGK